MATKEIQTCFVLSPFKEPFDSYFSKIVKPAIEANRLYAVRGDSLFRPATIMDDIWSGIRKAKLLVAELTERNPNVFYELGLAHAISKPVILISQTMDDIPFDLRAIRVLIYDKDIPDWGLRLKKAISSAIKEVVQAPLDSIPTTFKRAVHLSPPAESDVLLRLGKVEQLLRRVTAGGQDDANIRPFATPQKGQAFKPGDTVSHAKFGLGDVIGVEGKGDDLIVTVNFDSFGVKSMMASYLRIAEKR
jgi:hypothetical protein